MVMDVDLLLSSSGHVRYHVGSLAFGALILTLVQMVRIILEYLDHKTRGTLVSLFIYPILPRSRGDQDSERLLYILYNLITLACFNVILHPIWPSHTINQSSWLLSFRQIKMDLKASLFY